VVKNTQRHAPGVSTSWLISVAVAAIAMQAAHGQGQEDPPPAGNAAAEQALGEIVVTAQRKFRPEVSSAASKLELDIVDTPQALTVIGSELLNIADLRDTQSVVAYTAGIEATGVADGTEAYIIARGFLVDRYRSFRINGLSVYSEIDVDYFTMDRVEFVRGPASSLYGEADYGATVNRVLKTPGGPFAATLGAQFGSFDYRRLEGDVKGNLNSSGTLGGRLVGVFQDSDTFINGTQANHWVIAPSFSYELSDDTNLLFQAYYSKLDGPSSDGSALVFDENGERQLPDIPRGRNFAASTNDIDSSNSFYYGRVQHRFGDTLKATFAAGFSDVDMNNNSSYLCDCDAVEGDGIADLYYFLEKKRQKNTSFDLALEKSFEGLGREQRVMVSADWRKNTAFQPIGPGDYVATVNFLEEGGPFPFAQPDLDTGDYVDEYVTYRGVSLLAYLKPFERLSTLIGMRYSDTESGVLEYFGGPFRYSGEDDAWVPRAGLVYELNDKHNLFLSYSEGIIFNETSLDAGRNPIDPEQGVQYEAGFKGELYDDRLFYSLSAFTIDRSNLAQLISDPDDPVAIFRNVGRQTHRGVEIEMQGEPLPGLNLFMSYAYLDVEVKESDDPGEIGNTPNSAPKNSFSAFATYEILNGPLKSLTLGGGYVHRSEREIDNYGTFALPAYDRFDLRASYDVSENLLVELNVKNIFDEVIAQSAYEASIFGIGFSDVRSVTFGATYRF
jgi:iron complex outermembrane receptor protein